MTEIADAITLAKLAYKQQNLRELLDMTGEVKEIAKLG